MTDIILYGAGDLGNEFLWFMNSLKPKFNVIGFLDDYYPAKTKIREFEVLGNIKYFDTHTQEINVLCSIANPTDKKRVVSKLKQYSFIKSPSIIHPNAVLSDLISIGEGTVIGPNTVISVDVTIGNHVLINQNCSISHHVKIGDFSMIAPGCNLGGHVEVENEVTLGIGSCVIPEIKIKESAYLGAGSVVINDIPPHCKAVGVPAKQIFNKYI